jgi:hypothetical protein
MIHYYVLQPLDIDIAAGLLPTDKVRVMRDMVAYARVAAAA